MTAVRHQEELQTLGRLLQEQWQSPPRSPLKIQSTVHRAELLILAEHKRHDTPDPRQVFEFLESTLRSLLPVHLTSIGQEIAATGTTDLGVKLYLRLLSQRQPYAVHTFTVPLPSPLPSPAPTPRTRPPIPPPPPPPAAAATTPLSVDSSADGLMAGMEAAPSATEFTDAGSVITGSVITGSVTTPESTSEVAAVNAASQSTADSMVDPVDPVDPVVEPLVDPVPDAAAADWGELGNLTEVFAELDLSPLDLAGDADAVTASESDGRSPQPDRTADGSSDDRFPELAAPEFTTDDPLSEPPIAAEPSEADQPSEVEHSPDAAPFPLPMLAVGAGVAIASFVGAVYFFSRPCGFGACPAVPAAQQIQQQVTQNLQSAQSQRDVMEAKADLERAIAQLQAIPFWATAHRPASQLIQTYRQQITELDQVLQAFKQAMDAANKSQNPPHSADHWRTVSQSWDGAIAKLQAIPADSPAYPLAQAKLRDYQRNLTIIDQRVLLEVRSQQLLDQARTAAKQADTQSGTSQSLDSWRLAQANWQTAVEALSQIPAGTSAFAEAQQLLAAYNQKLTVARNTTGQEQNAIKAYNQALNFAQQAQIAEQKTQWLQAMNQWRQALLYARQIPAGSTYYQKIQPMITTYAEALARAEANVGLADAVRQAQTDLRKTCAGNPQICTFTITSEQITVRLTPEYKRSLVATAYLGDPNAQVGVQEHLRTLQTALETISDNANIPISVYDADNSLIGTHKPSPGAAQ